MAKNKKRSGAEKPVDMTVLLYLGLVFIAAGIIVSRIWPDIPEGISAILYIIGVLGLIIYMWQVSYERRTGRSESGGKPKNSLPGKK